MLPKVSKEQLLKAFEIMCRQFNKTSVGFDVDKIITANQWAIQYVDNCGWMIVSGLGGCSAALSRWNGYVQNRWDFLMMIEALTFAESRKK